MSFSHLLARQRFGILGSVFSIQDSGFGIRISCCGFRFAGSRFQVWGFGFWVSTFNLRDSGLVFGVCGSRFVDDGLRGGLGSRVEGLGCGISGLERI